MTNEKTSRPEAWRELLPVTINVDDLTLEDSDRAKKLQAAHNIGPAVANAYLGLARAYPDAGFTIPIVKNLRLGDVRLTDDAELAEDQGEDAGLGPTE